MVQFGVFMSVTTEDSVRLGHDDLSQWYAGGNEGWSDNCLKHTNFLFHKVGDYFQRTTEPMPRLLCRRRGQHGLGSMNLCFINVEMVTYHKKTTRLKDGVPIRTGAEP